MIPAASHHPPLLDSGEGWNGLVAAYLAEKYGRSGSTRTASEYGRLLARFFAQTRRTPDAVRPMDVHAFAYGRGPAGRFPSPSTIGVRLAAIGGFFDLAVRMGYLAANPALQVRRSRPGHRVPRTTSPDAVRQLLAAIPHDYLGIRDRALIVMAVMTGLRRAELAALRTDDVGSSEPMLLRVLTKGGHERRIEVPPPAAAALLGWLTARCTSGMTCDSRLFGLSGAGVYACLRRRTRLAGLKEPVRPHGLRHAAARMWRADGAPIEEIAALLGHASLATTARYLSRSVAPTGQHWQAVASAIGLPPTPAQPAAPQAVGQPVTKGRYSDETQTARSGQQVGFHHPQKLPPRRSQLEPPKVNPQRMDG